MANGNEGRPALLDEQARRLLEASPEDTLKGFWKQDHTPTPKDREE